MKLSEINNRLKENGLKITPQRVAILEAIITLKNHPTAENIIDIIRKSHPNISTATVYKVLDVLVESKLINKVKTDKDIMRYDAVLEKHHHIYHSDSDRIEDYYDSELTELLEKYFNEKQIPDFKIEDIKLQIIGKLKQ
ncbi:MAG: transcriptional repressor [Paludibacter sp.]|nr:transcriptional repressor [Paludibacter sp.]